MQRDISPATSWKLANMGLLCACLVVFIHVRLDAGAGWAEWWCDVLLKEGVCRIVVPFFFVAAGYFLAGHLGEAGWWGRELRKRARTLLIPYCAWIVLAVLFAISLTLAANALAGAAWTRNLPLTVEKWVQFFGLDVLGHPAVVPLWFVRCLLLLVVLSPLLAWPLRRSWELGALWVAVLGGLCPIVSPYIGQTGTLSWFWKGTLPVGGLFCFTVGMFLRRYGPLPTPTRGGACVLVAVGVVVFAVVGFMEVNDAVLADRLSLLGIAVTLPGVWGLAPAAPWPRALTGLAFPIFLLHTNFVLQPMALALGQTPLAPWEGRLPLYLVCGAAAIGISAALAWALRRFAPRAAAVLFGGR